MIKLIQNGWAHFKNMPLQTRYIWLFCAILLGGMFFTFLLGGYHLLKADMYYPYVTFLYDPKYIHLDFWELHTNLAQNGLLVYQGEGSNYPPLIFLLLYPLSFLPYKVALSIFSGLFILSIWYIIYHLLPPIKHKWLATTISVLACFPVLYVLNRANIEILLFLIMATFLISYQKKHFYKAAFWLAIAINIKIYPAVFLLLFISDKRFKAGLTVLAFTTVLFFTGFYTTGGNWSQFLYGFEKFSTLHQFTTAGLQFSNSLFNLIRFPVFFLLNLPSQVDWMPFTLFSKEVAPYYFGVIVVLCSILFYRLCKGNMLFWQKVFVLALMQTTFPFVSYNYTLILLLLPLCFFFQNPIEGKKGLNITVLTALAFIPMPIVLFCFKSLVYGDLVINIGSLLRPLVLLCLLVTLVMPNPQLKLPVTLKKW